MEQRQVQEMKSDLSPEGFLKNPARKSLVERWGRWIPTKDTAGRAINMNPHQKWCLAQLYENQLSELKSFKEKHMLGEDTTTVNTAPFIKYTFPLLRRVWPSLIAPEIVSIQPMTAPVGAVFYFELKYGQNKGQVSAGNRLVKDFNRTYSSQYIDGEIVGAGTGIQTTFNYTSKWIPVVPSTVKISATVGGSAVVAVDDGSGNLTGSGIAAGSTINYQTGAIHLIFSVAPDASTNVVAVYQYNAESNSEVPDVNIDIALVAVTAKSRKLKALWSSEAADDLKALHGVDAEQELVAGLGSELALEIDREIIEDIRVGYTGASTSYSLAPVSGVRELDVIRGILTPITLIANQIGKNTLRGPANWMVMSYDLAAYIEQLSTDGFFRPVFAGDKDAFAPAEAPQTWGMMKMGTVQSRFTAYKDPYLVSNELIMGFKGNSFVDAGYVWAPYVPLQVTATFLDPNDFRFRKGMRTRYAKLLARAEFYGKLTVNSLTSLSPGAFGPGSTLY
jgi:Major capsid protein Gp23